MAIFYTDTGSLGQLEISGSGNILNVKGSGSNILVVSGSRGSLLEISDLSPGSNIFTIASGSTDILTINTAKTVSISGSLVLTGSFISTTPLQATASQAVSASYAITASYALNGGGGGSGAGFPYEGTALITGSIVLTSGSGFPSLLAAESLTAGDLVNVYSGGVRKASSNDTTKQAHGFVSASYSTSNPVVVFYSGLNTNVTGLTAGSRYFLGTSGGETTTPPTNTGQISQEVGVAISTTALLFQPGPAIIT
jgi:hypothetical protein